MSQSHFTLVRLAWIVCTLLVAGLACAGGSTPSPRPVRPDVTAAPAQTPLAASTRVSPSSPIASIYNDDIPSTQARRITISELNLMRDAAQALIHTSWDGDKDTPLPITTQDLDQAKLAAYIANETDGLQKLTIPPDLEALYISPEAAQEIQALVLQAHGEYVAYLQDKGVLSQYIDEIIHNVLPADPQRIVYHPRNDPEAPPTATEGLVVDSNMNKDYARLQMNVYPVDIYNRVRLLADAQILGVEPSTETARLAYHKHLRDMAARQLIYHEMTHVLQHAYINLHVSAEERARKSAWSYATKTLIDVDTQYHWAWGGREAFASSNNRHISDESQAEGVSFEIFCALYDMSPKQSTAVWDHFFGRLDDARQVLNEIRDLFDTHYPTFSPDEFGDPLAAALKSYPDSSERYVLQKLAWRLSALPSYIGYINPTQPQDLEKLWTVLRQD